jgi:hypothetical protein
MTKDSEPNGSKYSLIMILIIFFCILKFFTLFVLVDGVSPMLRYKIQNKLYQQAFVLKYTWNLRVIVDK